MSKKCPNCDYVKLDEHSITDTLETVLDEVSQLRAEHATFIDRICGTVIAQTRKIDADELWDMLTLVANNNYRDPSMPARIISCEITKFGVIEIRSAAKVSP